MPDKPDNRQDMTLFQQAMKDVTPLTPRQSRIEPTQKQPPHTKKRFLRADRTQEQIDLNESAGNDIIKGEECVFYQQSGVANKTLRKLSKGQYTVQAILDLHGMTTEAARLAVQCFLQKCLERGIRVGLIIHGKGSPDQMPVLKNKLNHWLRDIHAVIAFCSAAPSDGGRGAMYILLKHQTHRRNSFG